MTDTLIGGVCAFCDSAAALVAVLDVPRGLVPGAPVVRGSYGGPVAPFPTVRSAGA